MLRAIGKLFKKGPRLNGGIGILESKAQDEETELVKPVGGLVNCISQNSNRLGDEDKHEESHNRKSSTKKTCKDMLSFTDIIGWGSVAAIALNACQIINPRRSYCCIPQVTETVPKFSLGTLVVRTVLAQPPDLALPLPRPPIAEAPTSFTARSDAKSQDVSISDVTRSDSLLSNTESDISWSDSDSSSSSEFSEEGLNEKIEAEMRALQEVEDELLRELNGTRVAAHAYLLNRRLDLSNKIGPFAVTNPFDDPERKAFLCFESNSQLGSKSATYNLAVCYERGIGTEKNIRKAVSLYKEAAETGHPLAKYNLGVLTHLGKVPDSDRRTGLKLIREAAVAGVEEAWSTLAEYFETPLNTYKEPTSEAQSITQFQNTPKLPSTKRLRKSVSEPSGLNDTDTGYASLKEKCSAIAVS